MYKCINAKCDNWFYFKNLKGVIIAYGIVQYLVATDSQSYLPPVGWLAPYKSAVKTSL